MVLTPKNPQVKQLLQSSSSNGTLYRARVDRGDYELVLQVDGQRHQMELNEEKSRRAAGKFVYEAEV